MFSMINKLPTDVILKYFVLFFQEKKGYKVLSLYIWKCGIVQQIKVSKIFGDVANSNLLVSFADNLCKQFGSRSGFVGPELDPNCSIRDWWYSWKIFSKKLILKQQLPIKQRVNVTFNNFSVIYHNSQLSGLVETMALD